MLRKENILLIRSRAGIAQSVERLLMEREVSRSTPTNAFAGMWKKSAQQPCWPPRGQQV